MATSGYSNLYSLLNESNNISRDKLLEFQRAMDRHAAQPLPGITTQPFNGGLAGLYQGLAPQQTQAPTDVDLTFHANPSSLIYDIRAVYRHNGLVVDQESGFIEARHIEHLDKNFVINTMLADMKKGFRLQAAIDSLLLRAGLEAAQQSRFSAEVESAFKKLKSKVIKDLALV